MLIKLDNHYKKFTNGFAEHEVEGKTVSECMSELCNRYPQLLVHLQDNDLEMCKKSGVKFNGEFLCDEKAPDIEVGASDVLELTLELPTGDDNVIKYIVGAVLTIVGVIMFFVPGLQFLAPYVLSMGISMLITTAVMDLFFTPDTPVPANPTLLDNSATYTFNGIQNTVAAGTAINVVYGTHRVGGHILNAYTTVEEETINLSGDDIITTSSYLYYQIGLSEGEISEVVDIEINKLPVTFYNEVTTAPSADYLRFGAKSQTSMPDFSKIMSTVSAGRKVLTIPNSNLVNTPVEFTEYEPMYGVVPISYQSWDQGQPYKLGLYTTQFNYYEDQTG